MPGPRSGGFLACEGHSTVFHIFIYYFLLQATCSFPYFIEHSFFCFVLIVLLLLFVFQRNADGRWFCILKGF